MNLLYTNCFFNLLVRTTFFLFLDWMIGAHREDRVYTQMCILIVKKIQSVMNTHQLKIFDINDYLKSKKFQ